MRRRILGDGAAGKGRKARECKGDVGAAGVVNLITGIKKLSDDAKIETLLDVADEGIGEKLRLYEGEQARGEKLNLLSEKYFEKHPRSIDEDWPSEKYFTTDCVMRSFMTDYVDRTPGDIVRLAKEKLSIELD